MNSKLREALERCVKILDICLLYSCEGYPGQNDDIKETMAKAEAALRMPRRNCDVGTAEEQLKRHGDWCAMIPTTASPCLDRCGCRKCFARWAQMPYEEGGAE